MSFTCSLAQFPGPFFGLVDQPWYPLIISRKSRESARWSCTRFDCFYNYQRLLWFAGRRTVDDRLSSRTHIILSICEKLFVVVKVAVLSRRHHRNARDHLECRYLEIRFFYRGRQYEAWVPRGQYCRSLMNMLKVHQEVKLESEADIESPQHTVSDRATRTTRSCVCAHSKQ